MGISATPRADHQIATCRCTETPILLPAAPVPLPAASVLLFGAPLLGPASSPLVPLVSVLQYPLSHNHRDLLGQTFYMHEA
jgi:hypothetical protein